MRHANTILMLLFSVLPLACGPTAALPGKPNGEPCTSWKDCESQICGQPDGGQFCWSEPPPPSSSSSAGTSGGSPTASGGSSSNGSSGSNSTSSGGSGEVSSSSSSSGGSSSSGAASGSGAGGSSGGSSGTSSSSAGQTSGGTSSGGSTSTGGSTCGADGQPCCSGNTCSQGLYCNGSGFNGTICNSTPCGANGEKCCAGAACNSGYTCNVMGSPVLCEPSVSSSSGGSSSGGTSSGSSSGGAGGGLTQCEPCNSDADCASGYYCVYDRYQGNGPYTFCSQGCAPSSLCPTGTTCGEGPSGGTYVDTSGLDVLACGACTAGTGPGNGVQCSHCTTNADCGFNYVCVNFGSGYCFQIDPSSGSTGSCPSNDSPQLAYDVDGGSWVICQPMTNGSVCP